MSGIPVSADVCRYCTHRIDGQKCPVCRNYSIPGAQLCIHCKHKFYERKHRESFKPFSFTAHPVATFFIRGRFTPEEIHFTEEKIIIISFGLFRLSKNEEEIPWHKVAGFDYRSGIFWDSARIETRGQSSSIISCLNKKDGEKVRKVLQQLEK